MEYGPGDTAQGTARDAKLLDIGAGTNQIRRMPIGRELIGA
jgi:isovaleryl-CoA dehydrogenase